MATIPLAVGNIVIKNKLDVTKVPESIKDVI